MLDCSNGAGDLDLICVDDKVAAYFSRAGVAEKFETTYPEHGPAL